MNSKPPVDSAVVQIVNQILALSTKYLPIFRRLKTR
jgi:hypothetical protein